jgi:putative transposase
MRLVIDSVFAQNRDVIRVLLMYMSIVLATVRALFRSRSEQAIVELALRQQLATYKHQQTKPKLTPLDRTFWVALSRIWPRWQKVLCIVQPETVVRWHRKGFALYWRSISKPGPGRPPISQELQALIRRLASENDWRARKIQAEFKKLGFTISLATVSRTLPKRRTVLD